MNNLRKLPKFIHQCMTIGEIPTSYKVSLTYEEQLMWFCRFLEQEVIPVVNNNSEVVEELKTYIEDYFKNLDVQEEINNKLDEMAEDGTLEELITEYINLKSILAFNTKAEMKSATNLVDGSFVKTYGTTTYNDGYGEFYKIRTLLNTDVVDENNIVALTNYPTLIAEKMPNAYINNLQDQIDLVNASEVILVGDSYAEGYGDTNLKGWGKYMIEELAKMGITATETYEGGAGFVNVGNSGHTFLGLLQNLTYAHKENVKAIIVLDTVNDQTHISDIEGAIDTFQQYAKLNYPNAKVYIGFCGNKKNLTTEQKQLYITDYLQALKNCNKYGCIYLNGTENLNFDYSLFYGDNVHLTNYSYIGQGVFNAFLSGMANINIHKYIQLDSKNFLDIMRNNNNTVINLITQEVNVSGTVTPSNPYLSLGQLDLKLIKNVAYSIRIPIGFTINSNRYNGEFVIDTDNICYFKITTDASLTFTKLRYESRTYTTETLMC